MPEGHTIHRLARDLNSTLKPGPITATSPQGPFSAEAKQINGRELVSAEAWGKQLFIDFEGAPLLQIHLGLIGKLRPKPLGSPEKGAIRLRLEGPETLWDLTGPMTCALIDEDDRDAVVAKLGPDPLRPNADADDFAKRISRRRIPIAAALLDQKVMAGIGNVYRSEFCYLAGIHPETPANSLTDDQIADLWEMAVSQLEQGVKLNRIVTRVPEEVGTTAQEMPDDERLYVYKREGLPCHRCRNEIRLIEVAKRKSWYCPGCQGSTP